MAKRNRNREDGKNEACKQKKGRIKKLATRQQQIFDSLAPGDERGDVFDTYAAGDPLVVFSRFETPVAASGNRDGAEEDAAEVLKDGKGQRGDVSKRVDEDERI